MRRNLEGQLGLRLNAGGSPSPLAACRLDPAAGRALTQAARAALPSHEQRLLQLARQQLAEANTWPAGIQLSADPPCARSSPLLVLPRSGTPGLPASSRVSRGSDARDTVRVAQVDFMPLLLQSQLEGRDRMAQTTNARFAESAQRLQLAELAASALAQLVAVLVGTPAGTANACATAADAASARRVLEQASVWARRQPPVRPSRELRELASAEAVFDALTARGNPCQLALADAASAQRLSSALARDKVTHQLVMEPRWTPAGLAEASAKAKGCGSAAQQALGEALKASPGELAPLAAKGVASLDELNALRQRAEGWGYPVPLTGAAAVLGFLQDEASGRQLKKSATAVARERLAAEDAARRRQQAADEAAQRKAEQAAAAQRKIDEADSDAERLSELAGLAGTLACYRAADAHVASVAKYAHKWDDVGLTGVLFGQYLVKVAKPGVLVMTSPHLAMQNGFGAFKRVPVRCHYDTRRKQVVEVELAAD